MNHSLSVLVSQLENEKRLGYGLALSDVWDTTSWSMSELMQLARVLRLAVHRGGGSIDPEENCEVRAVLSPLLLPYNHVHCILKECAMYERDNATYCLPMDYNRQRVAMVCKVRTNNLEGVKRRLINFLRQNKSRFFNRHFFKEAGLVEATFPDSRLKERNDFHKIIREDELCCKATGSCVIDITRRNVLFKCQPQDLEEMLRKLKRCGYKIIHIDHGYATHRPLVNLTNKEMEEYQKFLDHIKQDEDVVRIYDNVRRCQA